MTGEERHRFYVGDGPDEWEYGLVNVAAFLAHAMTESISGDACDEFHWERNTYAAASGGGDGGNPQHYAISNSCGQNGQDYQSYACAADEGHMQCDVDRNLVLQATTSSVYKRWNCTQ